jgi:diguanylate cyclase
VGRLFATHAAITLVPVLVLGLVLAAGYRSEAQQRGLGVGKSEARLVAQTAVEPILDGRPLSAGLTPSQTADLRRLVAHTVGEGEILRMRLRDLSGHVVFSDDGSGFSEQPEDEALEAAHGETVGRHTRLNSDSNDRGDIGPASVEVYLPLEAGTGNHRVGVLEVYLPYAPIQSEVTAGLNMLYRASVVGLAALYMALFAISLSVSKRLRRQVKRNQFLAEHDALTGLPNRVVFHQQGRAALARRTAANTVVALVDLDRFKEVNDTLGHHSGDELLRQLAERLSGAVDKSGSVARLGGDEFGIILKDTPDPETALEKLRQLLEEEVTVSGLSISVDSSVGYVIAPADGTDMDELVQRADVAMYLAKADHSGVCRYDPSRDYYDAAKLNLISELRHGIDADQLVLHYQPKAALPMGPARAVEALVRWAHPDLGMLFPDSFLPLAEQTELIDKLTSWVITRALTEVAELGPSTSDLAVAVNVSARNLIRPNFAAQVIDILHATGMKAERLIVEITETALLVDPARAATVLGQLAEVGVTVSVDDFGIGQTSLGSLSTLPVGELKIDKTFVIDMLENPAHAAIVRSVIDLGHNLRLRVVAEGVEDGAVLDGLRSIGCDLAQGFHIARPMPIAQLAEWLVADRARFAGVS